MTTEQQVKIVSMEETRVSLCARCGSQIRWGTTLLGKKMPLQVDAIACYRGAPDTDEASGKNYWPVPADRTHFPHCNRGTN